jgi:hypothetical protein
MVEKLVSRMGYIPLDNLLDPTFQQKKDSPALSKKVKFINEPPDNLLFKREFLYSKELENGHWLVIPGLDRCIGILFVLEERDGLGFMAFHALPLKEFNQKCVDYFREHAQAMTRLFKPHKVIIAGGKCDDAENRDLYKFSIMNYVFPIVHSLRGTNATIIRVLPQENVRETTILANKDWFAVLQFPKEGRMVGGIRGSTRTPHALLG